MSITLQEAKVSKAVSLILSLTSKKKDDVLDDEFKPIQMQIGVKKIPKDDKQMKLKLPCSIAKPDADICLFVKDLEKEVRDTEPTMVHFEELLSRKGVKNVKEIIPIKSLKTDYKPFESKWNLSNAYDVYLADERVVACLPRLLGKNFYGRKRAPTQVNLLAMDLKAEIDKALNASRFVFSSKGSTSMAVIGHSGMSQEHLTENVMAAVDQISTTIPGSSNNIKQLCIKARSSTSVPIYLAEGGPQDITIKKKKKGKSHVEIDELSTLTDGKVAVYPDGKVIVIKEGQTLKDAVEEDRKSSRPKKRKIVVKDAKDKSKSPAKKAKTTTKPKKGKQVVKVKARIIRQRK